VPWVDFRQRNHPPGECSGSLEKLVRGHHSGRGAVRVPVPIGFEPVAHRVHAVSLGVIIAP
jgi:hypothetical protein